MENKDPRSTWRKKNTYCKHYGVISGIKYDDAHKASGRVADTVSTWSVRTQFTAIPAFSSSGRREVPLEKQTVSEASHWPGPHSWEEWNWAEESSKTEHRHTEKRVGEGREGRKEPASPPQPWPSQNPHQAPVID